MTPTEMLPPPTEEQKKQAEESFRALSRFRGEHVGSITVTPDTGDVSDTITIPAPAFDLFIEIISQMAHGNAVVLMPHHAELTTQQAADFLNVSRPYLVSQLKAGKLKYKKVGTHRRVRFQDLVEYSKQMDLESQKALDDLIAESQEMGLY